MCSCIVCPVLSRSRPWLQDVRARLVPGSQLPLDARGLLAGDHTMWEPGRAAARVELWAHDSMYVIRLEG
jgi:hypothetical protein